MIQTFEFYGSGRQINATGRFFRYEQGDEGSGVTQLRLSIDGNRIGTVEPGDALELPAEASRWDLEPVSSGCVGIVRIGNVRITSDKLQGTVSVTESGRARSLAGVAFSGQLTVSSGSTEVSCIQFWNKAGSGKRAILTGVRVATSAASVVRMYGGNVQRTGVVPLFTSPGISKSVMGARSAACDLYGWRGNGGPGLDVGELMGFLSGVGGAMTY